MAVLLRTEIKEEREMKYSTESISYNNIDAFMWELTLTVQRVCACSISTAESLVSPLDWYIKTGRASAEFLHKLVKAKPFMIARRISHGGATDEVLQRVKAYVNTIEYEYSTN